MPTIQPHLYSCLRHSAVPAAAKVFSLKIQPFNFIIGKPSTTIQCCACCYPNNNSLSLQRFIQLHSIYIWTVSSQLLLCSGTIRALPDITSGTEVRQIFKIRTVQKPDVFLPGCRTFNTFKNGKRYFFQDIFFCLFIWSFDRDLIS